jgi:hypothetical protein
MTNHQIIKEALEIQTQTIMMGTYWGIKTCIESVIEHNGLQVDPSEVFEAYQEMRVANLN